MNSDFDVKKYLKNVKKSIEVGENIQSDERKKLAKKFIELYSFVKKDMVFVNFLNKVNGVEFGSKDFFGILYGFGFPEPEIIFSLNQYLLSNGYLKIGEYVDKRETQNWKGILYSYHKNDLSPVIYAKFEIKDKPQIKERYYPLCIGFKELVQIVFEKNFDEQFKLAYTPDFPA